MKILTKKSLDELAEVMPVIDELRQIDIIRGTFYYNESGELVGAVFDGNNSIRIGNSIWDPYTYSLGAASSDVALKVIQSIGKSAGISGNISFMNDPKKGKLATYIHEEGIVKVNTNSKLLESDNYYDYLSVLVHEAYHEKNRYISSNQNEKEALEHQMGHSSFGLTSDFLRSGVIETYHDYSGSY